MRQSHLSFVERTNLCTLGCFNTRQDGASSPPNGSISPRYRVIGQYLSQTLWSQSPAVLSTAPNSVNQDVPVNPESQRDFDVLSGVPYRSRTFRHAG